MGNKKGFAFDLCELPFKRFIAFFVIVLAATYLGFMPKVNLADGLVATTYIGTIAFLMAVGGILLAQRHSLNFGKLSRRCLHDSVNKRVIPELHGLVSQRTCSRRVLMRGGFQDAYIVMVGSILVFDIVAPCMSGGSAGAITHYLNSKAIF